jgi:glutathione peroxidase-family protein
MVSQGTKTNHRTCSHTHIHLCLFLIIFTGAQEPGTNAEIKEFAKNKGVEFTLMDKVNVNGPAAHDVFQFLKYKTSTSSITWNFATYFLISPDGTTVTAHVGVEPLDLKEDIFQLLNKDEL